MTRPALALAALALAATLAMLAPPVAGVMSDRVSTDRLLEWRFLGSGADTVAVELSSASWNLALASGSTSWLRSLAAPDAEPAGLASLGTCSAGSCAVAPAFSGAATLGSFLASGFAGGFGFSFEAWVRPTNVTAFAVLAGSFNTTAACALDPLGDSFALVQTAAGSLVLWLVTLPGLTPRGCAACTLVPTLTAGALVHVVVSHPDTGAGPVIAWVNGVSIDCSGSIETSAGTLVNAWSAQTVGGLAYLPVAFGAARDGSARWMGRLYLAALYGHALTAPEVAINLALGPYNTPPVVTSATVTLVEEATLVVALNATDVNELVASPTVRILSLPTKGALYQVLPGGGLGAAITTAGTVVTDAALRVAYVGALNEEGVDAFTFDATDGEADSASSATVSLTITPVDDVPTIAAVTAPPALAAERGASVTVGFALADVDTAQLAVRLHAERGLLTVAAGAGVTLDVGAATRVGSALQLSGTASALNAVLGSVTYRAFRSALGNDTVRAVVADATSTASAAVTVTALAAQIVSVTAPSVVGLALASPVVLEVTFSRAPVCGEVLTVTPSTTALGAAPGDVSFDPLSRTLTGGQTAVSFVLTGVAVGPVTFAFAGSGTAAAKYNVSGSHALTTVVASFPPPPPPPPTLVELIVSAPAKKTTAWWWYLIYALAACCCCIILLLLLVLAVRRNKVKKDVARAAAEVRAELEAGGDPKAAGEYKDMEVYEYEYAPEIEMYDPPPPPPRPAPAAAAAAPKAKAGKPPVAATGKASAAATGKAPAAATGKATAAASSRPAGRGSRV